MTTRHEALVLLAGSSAGAALPSGFTAGASVEVRSAKMPINSSCGG